MKKRIQNRNEIRRGGRLPAGLVLAVSLMLIVSGCATTAVNQYGHPADSITVRPSEVLFSGGLAIPVTISSINTFYPDYTEADFREFVAVLDEDPSNFTYYIPAVDGDVTRMARRYAYLAATFVFSEKTVGMSVTSLKRLARQRAAVNATEEELEILQERIRQEEEAILAEMRAESDEDEETSGFTQTEIVPLTASELEILTSQKLDELTDDEKAILNEVRINNSLAGAGITALIGQSTLLAADIADLIGDMTASLANLDFFKAITVTASIRTMKEIKQSQKVIDQARPGLDRNLEASRVVIRALHGRD